MTIHTTNNYELIVMAVVRVNNTERNQNLQKLNAVNLDEDLDALARMSRP